MFRCGIGSLTEKELDSSASAAAAAASSPKPSAAVERNTAILARLISHEFPLERAPEAIEFAIEHPAEVNEGGHPCRLIPPAGATTT